MQCGECEEFEFRRDHPVAYWRNRALNRAIAALAPGPSPITLATRSMSGLIGAAVGISYTGRLPASHYERHRTEYERTGSTLELDRMLRQVSDG